MQNPFDMSKIVKIQTGLLLRFPSFCSDSSACIIKKEISVKFCAQTLSQSKKKYVQFFIN
jgi:hypothetical protein